MYSQAPEAGIASLLASRGRKGDSMLVHMAPEEVQGLQSLAYAAGGQLSINPVTGLYEANFLKKLLPTILGFGLSFIPGVGPLAAAGLVGAGEAVRTGDLGKGLMAGLGAFGGAGLGSGLAAAGKAGTEAALTGVTPAGALPGSSLAKYSLPQLPGTAAAAGTETAKQGLFGTVQQGIQGLGTKAGREAFMGAIPGGTTGIAAGGMGLANALTPDVQFPDAMGQVDDSYYESEGYDPATGTFRGGRWRKGYPGFPPLGMAEGGDVTPARRTWEEMPMDQESLQPNSAKAGWLEFMQNNPAERQKFIDAGYPPEFFQQDPATFTGNRPFVAGRDEEVRASEQARIAQQGYSPTYFEQFKAPSTQSTGGASSGNSLTDYMNQLNQFVTSPIAPPRPPAPPPAAVAPPGRGGNVVAGGEIDYNQLRDMFGGGFGSGFGNLNFGSLGQYLQGGPGSDMRWDAEQGRFVRDTPAAPTTSPVMQPQQTAMMDPYAQMRNQMAGLGGLNQVMFRQGGNVPPMQYAAGGKFLKGPGDGMSDDIKANINGEQEARLADGEFVIPADVVSHLGNGSSNAGSRKLYDMMAKVRNARTGTKKQAPAVKVDKYLPA